MKKNWIKFCCKAGTLALLLLIGESLCHPLTDGFTIDRITSSIPRGETLSIENPAILAGPFTYLGKGAQCFAFASADGNYVLKFFKHSYREPASWTLRIPLLNRFKPFNSEKLARQKEKLHHDMETYRLAVAKLQTASGLVFLHLHKTSNLSTSLHIVDKLGIHHTLAADDFEFAIQKRAILVYPYLLQCPNPKKAISQLIDFFITRSKAGIFDGDPALCRNLGFFQDEPMQIDPGGFAESENQAEQTVYRDDIFNILSPLRAWLRANKPELIDHLDTELRTKL